MKVCILSITVGQGHNATSRALATYMRSQGHEVSILDTYKYVNPAIGLGVDKGYNFLGRFWPKLNETIYAGAEKYNGRSDMKNYFPWVFADLTKSRMMKYLESEQPDVIVSPIVMTAMMLTVLRENGSIDSAVKTVGIVTDYSLHPFWEYTDMDYFVCANELMVPSMKKRGIPEEKILPTGIPVDPKFSRRLAMEDARKKLGLVPGKETVIMSAGGMGFAGLTAAAKNIDELDDIQMVAVCGTNKLLKRKLSSMEFRNPMHVLGFVDNMDEYLDASDIIVTKPGGLSTSEAIAKQKPLLLTNPMPGVENMNHAFLLNNSLAVHTNEYQPFSEVIMQLRANDTKRTEMKKAQERWGKKDSAKTLGDFLEQLVSGSSRPIWDAAGEHEEQGGKTDNGYVQAVRGNGGRHHRSGTGTGSGIGEALSIGRRESRRWRFEL